ncbi:DNA fragmentation factor subunit beta [Heterocephalus glaber]|uniref:DNAation factor subunit beta n=1 Tax=Heterocephalus glaber TaxID=10181 RepID=G5CBI1_HETGA|nr:DNA fragmentation factor subunit beta [Heterocephalus glaber]
MPTPPPPGPEHGSRLCLYEDGTEVTEDYFPRVPEDAELVLLTTGQTWGGYVSDIGRFLSVFQEPHVGVLQVARQLLEDEQAPLRQKLLADLLQSASQNIAAETRAQDPPWFEGVESRFRNKSGYLRYSCESRIRGYLREVSTYASGVAVGAREEYLRVLDSMCQKLKAAQYHGSYFDREAEAGGRLCTPEGWFSCQGPFDLENCASKHSINPYSNRESRILFSTWNLDHMPGVKVQREAGCTARKRPGPEQAVAQPDLRLPVPMARSGLPHPRQSVAFCYSGQAKTPPVSFTKSGSGSRVLSLLTAIEKKRAIVPTLVDAIQQRDGREVAWEYFYSLLFTPENLKLVHIACHKKTTHKLECDPRRIYRPRVGPKRKRPARKRQ